MKTCKIIYLLIIILFISGCSKTSIDSVEKIVSPVNKRIPIIGTWEITETLGAEINRQDEEWIGKQVEFYEGYMSLGESILNNPRYQAKKVNSQKYLLFNSKSLPRDFEFLNNENEIEVITVIDGDKFFCDILIIQENEIVLKAQNNSFYLKRLNQDMEKQINENIGKEHIKIVNDEEEIATTGVLIGLRSQDKDKRSIGEYNYRTIWIPSINNEIQPILEIKDIYFPRRSGFWKIQIEEIKDDNRAEEYIFAHNISMEDNKNQEQLKEDINSVETISKFKKEENHNIELDFSTWGERIGLINKRINYIGNDYISIETTGHGGYIDGKEKWEKDSLQLFPIDVLPKGKSVNIVDILENRGLIAMESAWNKTIEDFKIDNTDLLYNEDFLENFGLERRLGHWFLIGRINYMKDKKFSIKDYNINIIPPSEVVLYDDLLVPWTNIKDRVPEALDGYTSPNKDISVILTKNELLIYDIEETSLGYYPKERLKLEEGETAIMAEWATGYYVENWTNILKKQIDDDL